MIHVCLDRASSFLYTFDIFLLFCSQAQAFYMIIYIVVVTLFYIVSVTIIKNTLLKLMKNCKRQINSHN